MSEKNPLPANFERFQFNCMSYLLNDGSKQSYQMSFAKEDKYYTMDSNTMSDGVTFIKSPEQTAIQGTTEYLAHLHPSHY